MDQNLLIALLFLSALTPVVTLLIQNHQSKKWVVKALAEAHETGELSKTLVKTVKLEILSTSEKQIDAGFQKFESKIEPMVSKIIEGRSIR